MSARPVPCEISVVVATYNRRTMLEHTLPSLLDQDYPATKYEVIVVVDGSRDGTADYARSLHPSCGFEVVEQENRGPAVARNAGIASAAGEFVLLMDDDIRAPRQLIRQHALGHNSFPGARIHGAIFIAPESPPLLPAWSTAEWYRTYDARLRAGVFAGDRNQAPFLNANSSTRREILRRVGGFDETIPFPREDFELALRIADAGVPSHYWPNAVAFEVFAKTSASFVQDATGFGHAEVLVCRKHPAYRSHSVLTPADRPTLTARRTVPRRLLPMSPAGTERILTPAVRITESVSRRPRPRRLGVRLLALQHRAVLLRAAAQCCGSAAALREAFDCWLPVLLYHRVGVGTGGLDPLLTVSPQRFERQIARLARYGYKTIRPEHWLDWREGRGRLPRKPLLITFDDAYAEVGLHALPVLQRYGFSALVFVVTDAFGATNSWDPCPAGSELPRLMTENEVTQWSHLGIDFGSHTRTHQDLTSVSHAQLEDEVRRSREDLAAVLDAPVNCFAYPYGRHNAAVENVAALTYRLGFTAAEGLNGLATPAHLVRRTPGDSRTLMDFRWRLRTGTIPLARVRSTLRLRSRMSTVGLPLADCC